MLRAIQLKVNIIIPVWYSHDQADRQARSSCLLARVPRRVPTGFTMMREHLFAVQMKQDSLYGYI